MAKITGIELTDQEAHDILTTAIEGNGIQYWASDYGPIYVEHDLDTLDITKATIYADGKIHIDGKQERKHKYVVDADLIKWAATKIVSENINLEITQALINEDIDSDAADQIIQIACFGEVIYG